MTDKTTGWPAHRAADGLTLDVPVGENAHMTIPDPRSFSDGGPEWIMRYGTVDSLVDVRFTIASLLSCYGYLLDSSVSADLAIRQLRLMRSAWKVAASG